jgi:hypothetical protein
MADAQDLKILLSAAFDTIWAFGNSSHLVFDSRPCHLAEQPINRDPQMALFHVVVLLSLNFLCGSRFSLDARLLSSTP